MSNWKFWAVAIVVTLMVMRPVVEVVILAKNWIIFNHTQSQVIKKACDTMPDVQLPCPKPAPRAAEPPA